MKLRGLMIITVLLWLAASACAGDLPGLKRDFTYKEGDGAVDVLREGKVVARYVYRDTSRPCIYPVTSPQGVRVTRGFPMEKISGEATDHPHQRSFWIAHGNVNGIDFWTEGEKCGKIVQTAIDFDAVSPGYWAIHTKNDWIGPDGKKVCEDERFVTFLSCDYGTVITTLVAIGALNEPLKLGDTKEGFFALRVAQGLQMAGGTGHILNSEGQTDKEAWGRPAKWCDYTGEIGGKTVGITLFDAPSNPGHPTFWHAQDYGLFAANPFGGAAFSGDPKKATGITINPRDKRMYHYAVLVHDGKLDAETLKTAALQLVGGGSGATPTTPLDGKPPKLPDPEPRPDSGLPKPK